METRKKKATKKKAVAKVTAKTKRPAVPRGPKPKEGTARAPAIHVLVTPAQRARFDRCAADAEMEGSVYLRELINQDAKRRKCFAPPKANG